MIKYYTYKIDISDYRHFLVSNAIKRSHLRKHDTRFKYDIYCAVCGCPLNSRKGDISKTGLLIACTRLLLPNKEVYYVCRHAEHCWYFTEAHNRKKIVTIREMVKA